MPLLRGLLQKYYNSFLRWQILVATLLISVGAFYPSSPSHNFSSSIFNLS